MLGTPKKIPVIFGIRHILSHRDLELLSMHPANRDRPAVVMVLRRAVASHVEQLGMQGEGLGMGLEF